MKSMKPGILILFAFSCLFFSCYPKKGNFSVDAPKDWIVLDTIEKDKSRFVAMHAPVESAVPVLVDNINIGILHYSSVDRYIRDLFDRIRAESIYFDEKESGSVTINNYKMTWKRYMVQRDKESELAEQKTYFVGDSGNIYQVVCTAGSKGIKNMQAEIDLVLASFKIL